MKLLLSVLLVFTFFGSANASCPVILGDTYEFQRCMNEENHRRQIEEHMRQEQAHMREQQEYMRRQERCQKYNICY